MQYHEKQFAKVMPHDIGYWIGRKYAILEAVLNLSCDDLG